MTGGATVLWTRRAGQMLRMIEFHVEAFIESVRKSLQGRMRGGHVRMADRAHRAVGVGALRLMTAEAILVYGKAGPGGIIIPMMTA